MVRGHEDTTSGENSEDEKQGLHLIKGDILMIIIWFRVKNIKNWAMGVYD